MNVVELIEKLKEFDPDLPVMLANYEAGFFELSEVHPVVLVLNFHTMEAFGPHERLENLDADERKELKITQAVCLGSPEPSAMPFREKKIEQLVE